MPPGTALPCMLELMTVLPQEAESGKIAVRPERRRAFGEELRAALPDALDVLGRRGARALGGGGFRVCIWWV